ncbi:MAG: dihydroorotate dehydrogenase electron transfer subunit [Bacteroidaceae bacterium]|nr:dihydroorotate dehydrogenase electron transfer subunit [Bacteroidaceae bacterium]
MKHILDLRVVTVEHPRADYVLLKLTNPAGPMPAMEPGQFVEVRVDGSATTFLRRPISINHADEQELWLLVHCVGNGTRQLAQLQEGDTLNCLLPLGHGYTMTTGETRHYLLIGGGVGTAPLLYLGRRLQALGHKVSFILGGRSAVDVLQVELFEQLGQVYITTNDGTLGEQGFVTQHSILSQEHFDQICTCGPKPMMQAVVRWAKANGVPCEVSLENMMACGLGACLCCVEQTVKGNVCVCKEGPVFDMNELNWE